CSWCDLNNGWGQANRQVLPRATAFSPAARHNDPMRKLTQAIVLAAAASMVVSPAIASASPAQSDESSGATVMPLSSKFRACDFTLEKWVNAVGYARGIAHLSTSGSTIVATVDMATAEPNMHYDVRIIQTPRPS